MIWITILFLILLIFIFIIMVQKSRFEIEYWREGADGRLLVNLRGPFGAIFPVIERKPSDEEGLVSQLMRRTEDVLGPGDQQTAMQALLDKIPQLSQFLRQLPLLKTYRPLLGYFIKHSHIESLTWETKLGTGNAAGTGILVGLAWSLKGSLLAWIQNQGKPLGGKSAIVVTPSFQTNCFCTFFHCILSIRNVHVITAQLRLFKSKLRQRKR